MPVENFNIGDIVKHKVDSRTMIVVGYGKPDGELRWDAKDTNKPICRFYQDLTQTYVTYEFITAELRKIES